ncbi:MAG: MBL fold metallo-hydrolase [Bacteroidia bacterium]
MKYLILPLILFFWQPALCQKQTITAKEGTITITPVFHGSLVFQWNGKTIYIDPYGGAERYEVLPPPDLVLITHTHGDHLDPGTLNELDLTNAELLAPQTVVDGLTGVEFKRKTVISNGEATNWNAVKIEAIPMYNLPEGGRHKKGDGNGYVLTVGDKRIYISGDTEGTPEMRGLKNIDVAFVCMNLPYTMDVEQAADAVLDFKPAIVYPYHYRGANNRFSDVEKFKTLVSDGSKKIEVRLLNWYPEVED